MDSTPHQLSSALVLVLVLSKGSITPTKYALHLGIRIPGIISYIGVLKNGHRKIERSFPYPARNFTQVDRNQLERDG